jgi:hypothetical protein
MYPLGHKFKSDEGSISVLVVGLFIVLFTLSMVLTDVTSLYLAKRSLTSITESAAQRGMQNLDQDSYYHGEYNGIQALKGTLGGGERDPGIPIDCSAGKTDAYFFVARTNFFGSPMSRPNLSDISIVNFECDGFQIKMQTSAKATLPIPIPFVQLHQISITSYAGTVGERAKTNNFYGLDIG